MSTFFTSDTHFGHSNIIRYSKRPFKDAEEMDRIMISNWNNCIHPGDDVYHLGDFAFAPATRVRSIIKQLNGNIHLLLGNHDKVVDKNLDIQKMFVWVKKYHEINVRDNISNEDQKIILCHYSFRVWNKSHYGSWNLFGHSHGSLRDDPNSLSMDVGVDPNAYIPVSYEQVRIHMRKKIWKPIDKHVTTKSERY